MAGVLPFHRYSGISFDRVKAKAHGWRANVLQGNLLYQLAAENTSFRFVCCQKELLIVRLHVCNRRTFRRVRRIWVRGNNATAFSHSRWR
jgi:hypothetical protein